VQFKRLPFERLPFERPHSDIRIFGVAPLDRP